MDPSLQPIQPPKDLKAQITETSGEFVKNNYEGFLHKLVNVTYSILKLLRDNIIIMIKMAFGKE